APDNRTTVTPFFPTASTTASRIRVLPVPATPITAPETDRTPGRGVRSRAGRSGSRVAAVITPVQCDSGRRDAGRRDPDPRNPVPRDPGRRDPGQTVAGRRDAGRTDGPARRSTRAGTSGRPRSPRHPRPPETPAEPATSRRRVRRARGPRP